MRVIVEDDLLEIPAEIHEARPRMRRRPSIFDPTELHHIEDEAPHGGIGGILDKKVTKFRRFSIDVTNMMKERVRKTYLAMHTYQTVAFVRSKHKKWLEFDHEELTIMDALDKLNDLIDESDPDLDLPNIIHAYQTAERIRLDHPNEDWFQLVGLVHDLGKIMAFYDEPQWCVVGDTFPVGCKPQDSIVHVDTSFEFNPDMDNDKYNTEYGIYEPHCGLDNVMISWGHDEYLYQVLKNHGSTIPEEGLAMIRYHSLYPWHSGGDYRHLTNDKDEEMLEWVQKFNKYDLYTKSTKQPNIAELKEYYQKLIDKYIPGRVRF